MTAVMERELAVLRRALGLNTSDEAALYAHFVLSPAEARVLGTLYRARGNVSTSRLAQGGAHDSVKVYISRLRAKLDGEAITGVPATGYALTSLGRSQCAEAVAIMLEAA
jgi:DNA-binding response OmpR family regulator